MAQTICGNIVALIGSLLMVVSGSLKDRKKIIYVQTLQISAFALSTLLLGGYTGTIINLISIVRNILCYKDKLTKNMKILLIVPSIILSLLFNNLGFIGLFPLISSIVYICFMNTKNTVKFKSVILFTVILWFIYDIVIRSYTSAIFDFFTIIASLITIYQLIRKK